MKRKRVTGVVAILVFLASFGIVGTGEAYWYDLGPGSFVDLSGTNSNLRLQSFVNPNLDSIALNLNVGQSVSFWYGNFWTRETRIDPGDTRVSNINAYLDFSGYKAKIPGQSFGFTTAFPGNVDEVRPLLQSVNNFLRSYPQGGLSPQQIINILDWSNVPAGLRSEYQAGLSGVLDRIAVNGVIQQCIVDSLLASVPDPNTVGNQGFSQGYFVTWNDKIPTLPDGTPDYGASGWIRIDDTPVDVYFGGTGHLQIEFDDVFGSGIFWLEPDFWNLPVIAKITHLADPVAEPGTLLLLVSGIAGLVGFGMERGRQKRKVALP